MNHKFRVGELVRLASGRFADRTGTGLYEVVRLLPESNGEFGYRIKGTTEPNERAVLEHEIAPAGSR